jgi:hypothetical protein
MYHDRMVTFPGPGGPPAISHLLVKQEFGVDGQEDSSSQEVQRVVALVIEHARAAPDQTLGVITMGIRHMTRVQAALDQAQERYQHAVRSFGLFSPRLFGQTSEAIFAILGLKRRSRPKPRSWAVSVKRDFGHDPLLDHKGKRMKWIRRIAPSTPPLT